MSVLDGVVLFFFVLFMVFMIRGFMLQAQEKNRDKIDRK